MNVLNLSAQDIRDTATVQQHVLGTKGETIDGRVYRYALAGAVDLSPGKICVAAAHVANHVNRTAGAAAAIGATQVSVSLGATAATADQYADGYLVVNDATGEGIAHRITGHAAAASSGTLVVNLAEPIEVALVASTSEVSLIKNPFKDVIVSPSSVSHLPVGVPNILIDDADYGWLQTRGYCSLLSDGVIAKGVGAIVSDAVDGAVETEVAGTTTMRVGFAPEATVDTEYRAIVLDINI